MPGLEDPADAERVRRVMRGNRSRDTLPEMAVRRELHRRGLRYRVDYRPLPHARRRSVDIAFTRAKIAVLIDGCFWHACPVHYVASTTRVDYWQPKIAHNVQRDAETNRLLEEAGWTVLRFWEHEIPADVADMVEEAVRIRRGT